MKDWGFITQHRKLPLEQRQGEADAQRKRTDKEVYPIIVDIYGKGAGQRPGMHRHKFSISGDATLAGVLMVVRKHANPKIHEAEALTGFSLTFPSEQKDAEQTLLCMSSTIAQVYAGHKSNDDLLYLLWCIEDVFGGDTA